LRAALRALPEELTDEAGAIVEANANEAARRTEQGYPQGPSGRLRRGVKLEREHAGRFGVQMRLRSKAPHSHIFERGTQARRTANGANRGKMPAADQSQRMIPIVVRRRKVMTEALKNLVRRAGFQVQ
jgi:hypothetical protein